jgi:hypothetical protein
MICHFLGELEPPLTFTRVPLHEVKSSRMIERAEMQCIRYLSRKIETPQLQW